MVGQIIKDMQMDGGINKWINRQADGQIHKKKNGQTDKWTDKNWMDRSMDIKGWTNR